MLTVPGLLRLHLLIAPVLVALSQPAHVGNTPSSGSKGGIAPCFSVLYICNDVSISGSKRSYLPYTNNALIKIKTLTKNPISPPINIIKKSIA